MGRPNAGKSSLLNAMMNQKVAITSPLPQTTRKSIRVLYSDKRGKIIFTDTPGIINKVSDLVGRRVNAESPKEVPKANLLVYVVDISRPKGEEENKSIGLARQFTGKKILVYNKIDKAVDSKDHLADYNYLEDEFDKTLGVSAIKGTNVAYLIDLLFELLPERELEEISEEITAFGKVAISTPSNDYISELIREKAYLFLREEVPYSVNVVVKSVVDKKKIIVIKATMFTNAERYKKMIIGRYGQKIKEIGFNARKELELMSGRKVFLELTVEEDRHWQEFL